MLDRQLSVPKFRNIQPYTGDGAYQTDVPFEYLEIELNKYIENNDLDMDSDFQRPHVWDEMRQIAFVKHIIRNGKGSQMIRFNCPDWNRNFSGQMVLVDGKQRINACLRFLHNEIPIFGYYYQEFQDGISKMINLRFMVNNLKSRAEVLRWYLEINEGGVVHTNEELDKVRQLLSDEVKVLQ